MRLKIDPERAAETFAKFSQNPALQESAQLFARGLPVAEMIQAMAMNENVLSAFVGFEKIYPYGNLERNLLEKIILRVSQLRECQFCTQSHIAIMNGLGIKADGSSIPAVNERERAALAYAEHVVRDSNRIPDEVFARLREAFSESEIVELTFHIGFISMLNLFNNALQVRYQGEFAQVQIH